MALLENKLTLSMRTFIKQYYDRWLVCEDSAATVRTQQQSVLGNRFFVNGHLVPMKAEVRSWVVRRVRAWLQVPGCPR